MASEWSVVAEVFAILSAGNGLVNGIDGLQDFADNSIVDAEFLGLIEVAVDLQEVHAIGLHKGRPARQGVPVVVVKVASSRRLLITRGSEERGEEKRLDFSVSKGEIRPDLN